MRPSGAHSADGEVLWPAVGQGATGGETGVTGGGGLANCASAEPDPTMAASEREKERGGGE